MDMIVRLNGLMGITLQPGDHLTIVPLDFSVVVDVSLKRRVTLRRKVGDKELPLQRIPRHGTCACHRA